MTLNIALMFELGPDDGGQIGGGVELHTMNLARSLVRLGHNVTYITGAVPGSANEKILDGVRIKRIDLLGIIKKTYNPQQLNFSRQFLFLLRTFLLRTNEIADEDFDIFHGHIYSAGISARILGKRSNSIVINTIHGSYYKYWKQLTSNRIKSLFYRTMERRLAPRLTKKSDYQIHTDYEFAEIVKNWVKPKFKNRIVTILNGVDVDKFTPNVKQNSAIGELDGPIVMTTRRLVAKNGVIFLVRSFKEVIRQNPEAKLVIIGDGPERNKIQREIEKLEIGLNVKLLGMVPNSQIPSYLAKASIVVVPSIVEASSISVLEAMAMKKPVVASDIPGIREITQYGKNCILVPSMNHTKLATAVLKLIKSEDKRKELGDWGYNEVLKNYTWEKKAKEIEQIYNKALNKQ